MIKIPFLDKFKKKKTEVIEQYTEIPVSEDDLGPGKKVIIDSLNGIYEVDKVMRNVRDGHIVIVRIKNLKDTNIEELKQCTSKMRNACESMNGDIIGVGNEWLLITPENIKITRKQQETESGNEA